MYHFPHVYWVKTKDIFFPILFLFLRVSFFFGVNLQVIFDDAVDNGISNCSCYFLPALDAGVFFLINQLAEAAATKPVIARLNAHRDAHYFEAERTSYLIFDGLS